MQRSHVRCILGNPTAAQLFAAFDAAMRNVLEPLEKHVGRFDEGVAVDGVNPSLASVFAADDFILDVDGESLGDDRQELWGLVDDCLCDEAALARSMASACR